MKQRCARSGVLYKECVSLIRLAYFACVCICSLCVDIYVFLFYLLEGEWQEFDEGGRKRHGFGRFTNNGETYEGQ